MMKWFLILLLSLGFNRADLNRDGRVDYLDLAIFSQEWLMADYYLEFDGAGRIGIRYTNDTLPPQFDDWVFTIEFLLRTPSDGSGGGTVFDAYDETDDLGILITCDSDGKPTIKLRSTAPSERTRTASGTFTAGTWYHCMVAFKSQTTLEWYINGVVQGSWLGAPYSGGYNVSRSFYIGTTEVDLLYSNYFKGDIRNFGYYVGKQLSAAEAIARYQALNFDGSEDGLSLAYNMNEGSDGFCYDILGGRKGSLFYLSHIQWIEVTEEEAIQLQKKVCEAIKTKFDAASFTYINNLYFEQASQDAGLDYAVFHWIDSTERHLMSGSLESVTIQFNIYMIVVDDVGASIQEFTDTFDWCNLTIPGYDHVSMERESTRNMQYVDDVWQIVLTYEILVSY